METSARKRTRKITQRQKRTSWREQRKKTKWSRPRRRPKVRRGRRRQSRARAKPRWGPKVVESHRHKCRVRIGHLRFNGGCFYHFRRKRRQPNRKVRRRRYIFDSFGSLYSCIFPDNLIQSHPVMLSCKIQGDPSPLDIVSVLSIKHPVILQFHPNSWVVRYFLFLTWTVREINMISVLLSLRMKTRRWRVRRKKRKMTRKRKKRAVQRKS